MKKYTVGLNLPNQCGLEALESELSRIAADGFDAAEICLSSFPLVIGGRVQQRVVDYMRPILSKFKLRYTGHVGLGMDLRKMDEMKLQRMVMFASIDAAAALGLTPLTFHYEEQSRFFQREEAFLQNMYDAADYAKKLGVFITIENIETEQIGKVSDFVRLLGHENAGMTVDLGHLWLSSRYFGYDYMEALRECAPLVRHVHVNDNTGEFEPLRLTNRPVYDAMHLGDRFEYGRGDIHIPPFWGNAPLWESFTILKEAGYEGVFLLEYYNERFIPLNAGVLHEVRAALADA